MPIPRLAALDRAIRDAGVPIDGVGREGGVVRIDFRPEATPAQRATANTIAAGFDFTPRRRRAYAALMTDLAALSAADRTTLVNAVLADFLREHPDFAASFGIAVSGEEVGP